MEVEDWQLLGEQREDGIGFQLARSAADGTLYRWEPLALKPKGFELADLQREIGRRSAINGNSAVLPISGVFRHEGRYWLAWPARRGRNLFQASSAEWPLEQALRAVIPLAQSYAECHQRGLGLGVPAWERLDCDRDGLFMPDPWLLGKLYRPELSLPPGLAACHPPEFLHGKPPGPDGDRFYLGLILYWCCTGHIPFPLSHGWPTRSLEEGMVIPPDLYRPGLHPELARVIRDLLAADPGQRPAAAEAVKVLTEIPLEKEAAVQLTGRSLERKVKGFRSKWLWKRHCRSFAPWAAGAILAILALGWTLGGAVGGLAPEKSPFESVQAFYRDWSDPRFNPDDPRPELGRDFVSAREQRQRLIQQLRSRPLAEAVAVKKILISGEQAVLRASLVWWEWSDTGWRQAHTVEELTLRKKGRNWQIIRRERVEPI
jgi:hypothetical protein